LLKDKQDSDSNSENKKTPLKSLMTLFLEDNFPFSNIIMCLK